MGSYSKKDSDKNAYVIGALFVGAVGAVVAAGVGIYYLCKHWKKEEKVQNAQSIPLPSPRPTGPKCIICQKETDKRNRITLGCNHTYHLDCYNTLQANGQSRCVSLSCRKS